MNDKDLERELRSQHGPREEGYVPTQLPMSLDAEHAGNSGPSWLLRAAVFVPVAVAGVLAVGVVSGILAGPGPNEFGSSGSASPSASSTPVASTGTGACGTTDVILSAEPWGGAAGSRGTVVTVGLAPGRDHCQLPSPLGASITNADGHPVVSSYQNLGGRPVWVWLEPGSALTVGVTWSNWCAGKVAEPVSLDLWSEGVALPVDVPDGADPVPPCLGEGEPSSLSVTELQPAS
jgi:hypothetical protein